MGRLIPDPITDTERRGRIALAPVGDSPGIGRQPRSGCRCIEGTVGIGTEGRTLRSRRRDRERAECRATGHADPGSALVSGRLGSDTQGFPAFPHGPDQPAQNRRGNGISIEARPFRRRRATRSIRLAAVEMRHGNSQFGLKAVVRSKHWDSLRPQCAGVVRLRNASQN